MLKCVCLSAYLQCACVRVCLFDERQTVARASASSEIGWNELLSVIMYCVSYLIRITHMVRVTHLHRNMFCFIVWFGLSVHSHSHAQNNLAYKHVQMCRHMLLETKMKWEYRFQIVRDWFDKIEIDVNQHLLLQSIWHDTFLFPLFFASRCPSN